MNDAQTLALIHAVAWPILILVLSKMIWDKNAEARGRFQRPVNALRREIKSPHGQASRLIVKYYRFLS